MILKRFAQALAEEKGMMDEFKLYDKVEVLPENWSWNTESCSKMFAQMLTSTVASFTQCLVFRKNFLLRSFATRTYASLECTSSGRADRSANKIIRPAISMWGIMQILYLLMRDNKQNDKSSDFQIYLSWKSLLCSPKLQKNRIITIHNIYYVK